MNVAIRYIVPGILNTTIKGVNPLVECEEYVSSLSDKALISGLEPIINNGSFDEDIQIEAIENIDSEYQRVYTTSLWKEYIGDKEEKDTLAFENRMFGELFSLMGVSPEYLTDLLNESLEQKKFLMERMHMFNFETANEGLIALKEDYTNSEVCGSETADFWACNHQLLFHPSIPIKTRFEAIQKFREWDFDDEDESRVQIFAEKEMVEEYGVLINNYQDYCFDRKVPVEDGTRIGVEITNELGETRLELDEGIYFC